MACYRQLHSVVWEVASPGFLSPGTDSQALKSLCCYNERHLATTWGGSQSWHCHCDTEARVMEIRRFLARLWRIAKWSMTRSKSLKGIEGNLDGMYIKQWEWDGRYTEDLRRVVANYVEHLLEKATNNEMNEAEQVHINASVKTIRTICPSLIQITSWHLMIWYHV